MTVRLLDDRVVDQIAAGEVVERPASVVKELVENALDAGATRLVVRLRQGGVAAIEIVDDGCGMSRADAALCVERHATSKIRAAEDLVGVSTFGFRGEALAAIGAVSELRIRTRREEDEVGTEVVLENGRMHAVRDVATPKGTEMSVRSLFAAIPARRHFLRTKQTELDHAVEAVRRALLARPDVSVVLTHDGHDVLRSEAGPLAQRVRDLLGEDAGDLVAVDALVQRVRVTGLISPPGVHRPTAVGSVYCYVNGRFVRDPVVRRAIAEAWRGVLPPGRSPVAALFVDVPGEDVDVNVHPQKTEVRFHDARAVGEALMEGVRSALRGAPPPVLRAPSVARGARAPSIPAMPSDLDGGLFRLAPSIAAEPSSEPAFGLRPPEPMVEPPGAPEPPMAPEPTVTPPPPSVEAEQRPSDIEAPAAPMWRSRPLVGVHDGRWAVLSDGPDLLLVDLDGVRRADLAADLAMAAARGAAVGRPRLVPARVDLARAEAAVLVAEAEALSAHGVEISALGPGVLALVTSPVDADPGVLMRALAARPQAPAEVMASVATLTALDLAAARGLLARLDEDGSLARGRVVRIGLGELVKRRGEG